MGSFIAPHVDMHGDADIVARSGLEKLSAADKLSLVTELWEELEGMNEALSVSDQHKMMLDERYARHGEHPEPGKSWPEVKDRLLNEIGD